MMNDKGNIMSNTTRKNDMKHLLFIFFIFFSSTGFAQQGSKKLDISFSNNTLEQCFDSLQQQSGIRFFYDAAEVKKIQPAYSRNFKQALLPAILDWLLEKTELHYEMVDDKKIVIRKKNQPGADSQKKWPGKRRAPSTSKAA
jgi:hypothetical protein